MTETTEKPQPDLSAFFRLSRPKKKPCALGFARTQIKPVEREQLDAACVTDNGIITASAIVEWLGQRGQTANTNNVVSHRKRMCSCYDES